MIGMGALTRGATGFTGHAIGAGINVGMEKLSGESTGQALVKGVGWYIAEQYVTGAMMLPMLVDVGKGIYNAKHEHDLYGKGQLAKYYKAGFGSGFNDNYATATMRQRGVQALQQSKMNARSVLGSEARAFHR